MDESPRRGVRAGSEQPLVEPQPALHAGACRTGRHPCRRAQSVHEGLGRAKLCRPSTLRDVARQHHHIRPLPSGQSDQGFDHLRLFGTEVRVGYLQQHSHG